MSESSSFPGKEKNKIALTLYGFLLNYLTLWCSNLAFQKYSHQEDEIDSFWSVFIAAKEIADDIEIIAAAIIFNNKSHIVLLN